MARRTLSQEVKNGILSDLALGVSPVTIAAKFSVSIPTVYNYKKNAVVAAVAPTTGTESLVGTTADVTTVIPSSVRKASKRSR
jgi:hypothetical protein